MKRCVPVVVCVLLLSPPCATAATALARFSQWRSVGDAPLARDELVTADLDADVYANTRDGFPDLRLADETGAEVPFLLEKATVTETRPQTETCPTEVVSLNELPGNCIEVVVRATDPNRCPDHLRIETPLRDYEKRVSVSSRQETDAWRELVREVPVFDYTRYMDVRQNRVDFGASSGSLFRVTIDNVADVRGSAWVEFSRGTRDGKSVEETARTMIERRDFRIDRLVFFRTVQRRLEREDRTTEVDVLRWELRADDEKKRTEIVVQTRRQPLSGLSLESSSRNYSRTVEIECRSHDPEAVAAQDWLPLATGQIASVEFRNCRRLESTVPFRETRAEEYRIFIRNEDNPALTVTGVRGLGKVYRMVFLGYAGRSYHLYYGCATAPRPSYDLSTVMAALPKESVPLALNLGPAEANPRYAPDTGWGWRRLLESRTAFLTAVVLMVGVLGWGVSQALKKVDAPPPQ